MFLLKFIYRYLIQTLRLDLLLAATTKNGTCYRVFVMRSAKALRGQGGPKNLVWQRCSFCYNQLNASIIYQSYFVFVNSLFTFVHIIFIFQIKGPVNFNFFCGGRKFRIVFVKTVRDKNKKQKQRRFSYKFQTAVPHHICDQIKVYVCTV